LLLAKPVCLTDDVGMDPTLTTLIERIERGHADEVARQASLLAETSTWFERVRQFRETEAEMMVLQAPAASALRLHRAYLSQLIAQGESLVIRVRLHGLPPNHSGISLGAVEAELESLSLTHAQWHSGMTEARKHELFQEVFGEQKPEA
jgi:hypothetical protein